MPELQPATEGTLSLEQLERGLGVFFIGYVFMMVLYGFTFFQSYMYYSRYPKDRSSVKFTVALLCALDTAVSVILSQALYYYLVDLFPYTLSVEFATAPYCAQQVLAVIAVFVAQMYYASAVWSATKNALIAGASAVFATASLALGTTMSIQLFKDKEFAHLADSPNKVVAAMCFGMAAASGLLSFVTLSTSHLPPRVKPINGLFDIIVSYFVSRGGLAIVVQLALVFVFVGKPEKIYWFPFHVVATKLFVVGAITMLNSREGDISPEKHEVMVLSSTRTIGGSGGGGGSGANSGLEFNKSPIVIEVAQSTQQTSDKAGYNISNDKFAGVNDYSN